MATLLDFILLMVISKEAVQLEGVPGGFWATYVIGLPALLGMATSLRERPALIRNWLRSLVGQGVTVASLILFVGLLTYRGLAAAFWVTFASTLVAYGLGRALGLTVKALIVVTILIALAVVFLGWVLSS